MRVRRCFRPWPDAFNAAAMLRVDRGLGKERRHALGDALADVAHRRVIPGGARQALIVSVATALNVAALPQPRLKIPERSEWSRKSRLTCTTSSMLTKSRRCSPAA